MKPNKIALQQLLVSMFTASELNRFLVQYYPDLSTAVATSGPLDDLVFSLVMKMERDGLLDETLCAALVEARSRRADEIRAVWGLPADTSEVQAAPPPDTKGPPSTPSRSGPPWLPPAAVVSVVEAAENLTRRVLLAAAQVKMSRQETGMTPREAAASDVQLMNEGSSLQRLTDYVAAVAFHTGNPDHEDQMNALLERLKSRAGLEAGTSRVPAPRIERPSEPERPATDPSESYDVFLSHNSKDKPAVEKIARQLVEQEDLRPFFDDWHLVPGQPWQEALESALAGSHAVAVFVGLEDFGPWHTAEMRASLADAVTEGKSVIPVLLPGCRERPDLPPFLRRMMWVDLSTNPTDLRRLVAGIRYQAPGREASSSPSKVGESGAEKEDDPAEQAKRGFQEVQARFRELALARTELGGLLGTKALAGAVSDWLDTEAHDVEGILSAFAEQSSADRLATWTTLVDDLSEWQVKDPKQVAWDLLRCLVPLHKDAVRPSGPVGAAQAYAAWAQKPVELQEGDRFMHDASAVPLPNRIASVATIVEAYFEHMARNRPAELTLADMAIQARRDLLAYIQERKRGKDVRAPLRTLLLEDVSPELLAQVESYLVGHVYSAVHAAKTSPEYALAYNLEQTYRDLGCPKPKAP